MPKSIDYVNHKDKPAALDPARAGAKPASRRQPPSGDKAARQGASAPGIKPAPEGKPPSDDVLDIVHTLMHRVRSLRQRALRGLPHELTPMDMRTLGFFGRHPGATQSDLAQHSGRDKAQLARLVKGLRDSGLLEARADAADRRNQQLFLTPEGEALHQALRKQGRTLGAQAVAGLSAAECDQLRTLLQRVDANLLHLADEQAAKAPTKDN